MTLCSWHMVCIALSVSCMGFFSLVLQVPENYRLERGPVKLHGDVTSGFGRGSRQLGFATANLPPKPLATELEGLPKGVYFG
jgi:hypothetical protein